MNNKTGLTIVMVAFFAMLTSVFVYDYSFTDAEFLNTYDVNDDVQIPISTTSSNDIEHNISSLSIPFMENVGQEDDAIKFYADTFAGRVLITDENLTYLLNTGSNSYVIQEFLDSGLLTNFQGLNQRDIKVNYYKGSNSDNWHSDIPSYDGVSLGEVWTGIDVSLYAHGNNVEKIFTVMPYQDTSAIQLSFDGISKLQIDIHGDLMLLNGEDSVITMSAPIAYQEINGERVDVSVDYSIIRDTTYGFTVGNYDNSHPLVIDPVIEATYLGGDKADRDPEFVFNTEQDEGDQEVYVAFRSKSDSLYNINTGYLFPANWNLNGDNFDVVVLKLSNDLSQVLAATYFGTANQDSWPSIAFDPSTSHVFIQAETNHKLLSNNKNNAQTKHYQLPGIDALSAIQNRTTADIATHNGDVFISKFDTDLNLIRTTYYGSSSGYEEAMGIRIDSASPHDVFIVGMTNATTLPEISGGILETNPGGQTDKSLGRHNATIYMAKISNDLTQVKQSTFFGGASDDGSPSFRFHPSIDDRFYLEASTNGTSWLGSLATVHNSFTGTPTDIGGNTPLTRDEMNSDNFVVTIDKSLQTAYDARYLGGSGFDNWMNFEISPLDGNLYLTGETYSLDFPIADPANAIYDKHGIPGQANTFVAVMDSDLSKPLIASTYIGIAYPNDPNDIALDAAGNVYVSGQRNINTNFDDLSLGEHLTEGAGGEVDMFIIKLNKELTDWKQTILVGGSLYDNNPKINFDKAGYLYLATDSSSIDFPGVQYGASSIHSSTQFNVDSNRDAVIVRINPSLMALSPDAPTLDVANPAESGSVFLSWTPSANTGGTPIINYLVEYTETGQDLWNEFAHDSTATSTTVNGLVDNTTYDFRVTTITDAANSIASTIKSATPNDNAPSSPTGLTATLDAPLEVTLDWIAPVNTGSSIIKHYIVEYREESLNIFDHIPWTIFENSTSTTSTVTNLRNATNWEFQVSAENLDGYISAPSDSIIAAPFTVPEKPTKLQVVPGDGQFFLEWLAPFDGGSPITHYYIEYKFNNKDPSNTTNEKKGWNNAALEGKGVIEHLSTNANYTTATIFDNTRFYDFRVIAANLGGNSTESFTNNNNQGVDNPQDPPTSLNVIDFGDGFVSLDWDAPGDLTDVDHYSVQYRKATAVPWTFFENSTSTDSIVTDLDNGALYQFKVFSANQIKTSFESSNIVTATPVGVPLQPTNVFAVGYDSVVLLSWKVTANGIDGGSPITDYHLEYKKNSDTNWISIPNDDLDPTELITGLSNGVPYDFRVTAENLIGLSIPSEIVTATPINIPLPEEFKKSGGGCADCTPPTFGKNKAGAQVVSGGFTFNNFTSVDVTDYHTEFPLITVITNVTNTATVKVYENRGISSITMIQFGLGMPEVGSPLNDAQTLVEIALSGGAVDETTLVDSNNLVDVTGITTEAVKCSPDSSTDCLELSMNYIYRDQPKYNIMAINAIDLHRNSNTNYMNDGILVTGESINDPLTQNVSVSNSNSFYPQKAGMVTLTLVDYKTDMWQDEFGYMWSTNDYGPYLVDKIPQPIREPDTFSNWSGYNDRLHSEFEDYKQKHTIDIMNQMSLLYYDADSFTTSPDFYLQKHIHHDFEKSNTCSDMSQKIRDGCDYDEKVQFEIQKAQKVMDMIMDNPGVPYDVLSKSSATSKIPVFESLSPTEMIISQIRSTAEQQMAFTDINFQHNIVTISGNIGQADKTIPVYVVIYYEGEKMKAFPLYVTENGDFSFAGLSPMYEKIDIKHNDIELN